MDVQVYVITGKYVIPALKQLGKMKDEGIVNWWITESLSAFQGKRQNCFRYSKGIVGGFLVGGFLVGGFLVGGFLVGGSLLTASLLTTKKPTRKPLTRKSLTRKLFFVFKFKFGDSPSLLM
jgi:hypothetical protein